MQVTKLPTRGFSEAEYVHRVSRVQMEMLTQNVDALLLTTEADFRYFTGFLTPFWQSPTRPWFLVIPASGKPVAVIPGIGEQSLNKTWIDDIRTWSAPHPIDDGIAMLASTIDELAGKPCVLGIPMGQETSIRMPLNDVNGLLNAIQPSTIVDATMIVRHVRFIKSETEIDKIRMACSSASKSFARMPEFVREGITELEAFREFKITCLEEGADDCAFLVGGSGADGYMDIISPPSERKLKKGDVLIMDTGCVWDGYYCDFDRNFAIGAASDKVKWAYDTVWKATEAGINAIKPGMKCSELFAVMADTMPGADADTVGRLGHGLGIQLTEPPSLTSYDNTVLEEGMVMTLEPGMNYGDGKMMVHEENVVVRADKCELLSTRAANEIVVI